MRVLIVGPRFHGYLAAMGAALEHLGHGVSVHAYDAADTLAERVRNKALHDLPGKWTARWADWEGRRAAAVLDRERPDALLVVKGDRLGDDWWAAVDRWNGPRVTWLYDEIDRMAYTREQLAAMPVVATYSAADAASLAGTAGTVRHLPLGHDSLLAFHRRPTGAVTFIGARYPQRKTLLAGLVAAGIPVRAYGRDWSRHPADVLASRHWRPPGVPAGRTLARDEAYGVMAGSEATLNIHGHQDGFTMRTFEACGVGALQLVDRADVDVHFEPGREVLVFADGDELAEHAERAIREPVWARGIAEAGRRRALAEHTLVHRMREVEVLWA